MDEIRINFIFENNKIITKNCKTDEYIRDIIIKLSPKINNNRNLEIDEISIYYKGIRMDNKTKVEYFKNEINKINIFVIMSFKKKTNISNYNCIYCQKCNGLCLITLNGYRINLHDCEKGCYTSDLSLEEFGENSLNDSNEIIDMKSSYCIHFEERNNIFYSFCNDCKMNLCLECEQSHKKHTIFKFDDIFPSPSDCVISKKEKLDELKEKIDILKSDIQNIIKKLNNVEKSIDIYYNIYNNIINCYGNYQENYYILKNIYNNEFDIELNQINEIIQEKNDIIKYTHILKLYKDINDINHIKIKYKVEEEKDNRSSSVGINTIVYSQMKVFGNIFIENNKNKCKMIINNKESELMEECFLGSNDNEIILLNIKQITDMSYMFYNCTSLLEIYGIDKWDTSSVTNMSNLFYYCNNLKNLPDISKWNTKNVINMNNMFSGCKFTSLPDISLWDTSSVTNMSYMFFDCKNINQLPDISKWNISKVNNLSHMFHNCESLKEIPLLDNWDLRSVVDISYMFYNCANISGHINLQQWNLSNITCKDNIFDGCPQSFIDNLNSVNCTQNNPNDKNNCLIV